jgi:hypothetical protein
VAGVRITLKDTPYATESALDGTFIVKNVLAGPYELAAEDTAAQAFGMLRRMGRTIQVVGGANPLVTVVLATDEDRIQQLCRGDRRLGGLNAVVGRVVRANGVPLRARVAARSTSISSTRLTVREATLDVSTAETGTFHVCWLPPGHLSIRARADSLEGAAELTIADGEPLATVTLILAPGAASTSTRAGSLAGVVRAGTIGHHTVSGAEISIPSLRLTTRSDSTGLYRLVDIPAGRHTVTVRAIGYSSTGDTVDLTGSAPAARDFVLSRSAVGLDTVVTTASERRYVSPALRAFEERRKQGFGRFVTDGELRGKWANARLSQVVRELPGLRVVSDGRSFYAASSRQSSQGVFRRETCYATVYLDGALLYDASLKGQSPRNLDDFPLQNLAGIEYYPSDATAPAGLHGGNCGVLALWSRER